MARWLTCSVAVFVACGSAVWAGQAEELPIRMCRQRVEVSGVGGDARVEVMPLYRGAKWAITSRWDDNPTAADLKMGELLGRYGQKGTFYVVGGGLGAEAEKTLIAGGHAVQSHTLTHAGGPGSVYNKTWEEYLKSRIDIEARTDVPVNALAFPGNGFVYAPMPEFHWAIYRVLRRCGYVHAAWSGGPFPEGMEGLSGNLELPGDGHPIEPWFGQRFGDESQRRVEPNLSFCTHAWAYENYNKWEMLEEQIKSHSHLEDCWYCTQSEYGSYRFQREYGEIENIGHEGGTLSFELARPSVLDAGASVPLTLEVTGVVAGAARVAVDGQAVEADRRSETSLVFSVPYPVCDGMLPELIDAVYVKDEPVASTDFPSLSGAIRLSDDERQLRLELVNGGEAIEDVVVTYRLPLAAEPPVVRREWGSVAGQSTLRDAVDVRWVDRSFGSVDYPTLLAAQVDFTAEGRRGRLYVAGYHNVAPVDAPGWYPAGNFLVLSPSAGRSLGGSVIRAACGEPDGVYELADGARLSWQACPAAEGNSREYVGFEGECLFTSLVDSPKAQEAKVLCLGSRAIWINGRVAENDQTVALKEGANRVVVLSTGGFYWRLRSAADGRRLEGLRYSPPVDSERVVTVGQDGPYRMFVTDWLICGPFPNPGARPVKQGFDVDYLVAAGGEAKVEANAGERITWNEKQYGWTRLGADEHGSVDLMGLEPIKALEFPNDVLVYAGCVIRSKRAQTVRIGIGSDDGYKLYVNHELVRVERAFRGAQPDQEVFAVTLREGDNVVLLKIDQDFGQYNFFFTLSSPTFEALEVAGFLPGL